jgi:hypothetical protein
MIGTVLSQESTASGFSDVSPKMDSASQLAEVEEQGRAANYEDRMTGLAMNVDSMSAFHRLVHIQLWTSCLPCASP